MKRNIERIINELQHDSKVQAMHAANVAKRQALRERRRALMLARRNKHLPMVVVVEAVEGNTAEWLDLRIAEAIRRIESTGCDWLDYLQEHDANENVMAEFMRVWSVNLTSEITRNLFDEKIDDAIKNRSVVDGITVLHPDTFSQWLNKGSDWIDEWTQQEAEELRRKVVKGAHFDKARQLFEEEEERYTLSDGSVTTDFLAWAKDKVAANKAARHAA